jgi:hypothetical protein
VAFGLARFFRRLVRVVKCAEERLPFSSELRHGTNRAYFRTWNRGMNVVESRAFWTPNRLHHRIALSAFIVARSARIQPQGAF